jgi:hypothetical protein
VCAFAAPCFADADHLAGLAPLRVQFQGRDCYGMWQADVATLTIHLTGTTNATLVYTMLDEDSAYPL